MSATPEFDGSPPAAGSVDCLGVRVALTTWDPVASWVFAVARRREARRIFIVNAHTINLASEDVEFREVLDRADLILNDGVGLALYARMAGTRFRENFIGTDLLPRIFDEAGVRNEPLRVFLYGAAAGRAELAAKAIADRYDTIEVVGALDGYRREGVVETIERADPDVLLVGMGNPLQEKWIDAHRRELHVGVVFGVGALIDVLSGEVRRAPKIVRVMRSEWVFRLAQDPKRLGRRYLRGNPLFLLRSVAYIVRARVSSTHGGLVVPVSPRQRRRG